MRGVFAHPYSQAPTLDEVRAALAIAVEAVLSQPSFLRHGYITQMLNLIFTNRTYLDDVEVKVQAAARDASRRVLPELHPYLVKKLAESLQAIVDDPDAARFRRRAIWFARAYLRAVDARLSEEDWNTVTVTTEYPDAMAEIASVADLWRRLPEHAQDILIGTLLEGTPSETFSHDPGRRLPLGNLDKVLRLEQAGALTARQRERVPEAIEESPLRVLANSAVGLPRYVDRVIAMLASHNWYKQNIAVDVLRTAGVENVGRCSHSDQEILGRNVLQAAEGTAGEAEQFMEALGRGNEIWPSSFIRGALFECFVDDDHLVRFKTLHMKVAIQACVRGSTDRSTSMLDDLSFILAIAEPKVRATSMQFDEALRAIADALNEISPQETAFHEAIGRLTETLGDRREALTLPE
jgi:hypothetical protein